MGRTRWSHEYCGAGEVLWGEAKLRVNTTHTLLAVLSPAVPWLTLCCALAHLCCATAPRPHPGSSCTTPASQQPDLPNIHTQISPNAMLPLPWEVPFSVPELLPVEGVSLLVLVKKESAMGSCLSFDFHLKVMLIHGESINKPIRKSRLKIAGRMGKNQQKTISLELILCQDPPLFWGITVVQESQHYPYFIPLFQLLTTGSLPCHIHLPYCPDLTHKVLFVSIICIPKDSTLVTVFQFWFYYDLNYKIYKVLIVFCCPNAFPLQQLLCFFYHRAVLVVAWGWKGGRSFPIPVVTGSMQTRDNPGPNSSPP